MKSVIVIDDESSIHLRSREYTRHSDEQIGGGDDVWLATDECEQLVESLVDSGHVAYLFSKGFHTLLPDGLDGNGISTTVVDGGDDE